MEEKKYILTKEFSLAMKILISIQYGIDYFSAGSFVDLKIQKENIQEILNQILSDPELIRVFDSTDSKFWNEVINSGILIYSQEDYMPGEKEQQLAIKKQSFSLPQNFQTISDKTVYIEPGKKINAFALKKKKKLT